MRIAILGSGGREHALSWKFAQELGQENVFCWPGNAGIPNSAAIDIQDFEALAQYSQAQQIDYIFVGPEQPLTDGIVDYFRTHTSIQIVGPTQAAAQLEASKIFAKNFMQKYGVSTAKFKAFSGQELAEAKEFAAQYSGNLVLKFDGLAGGKGVFVCSNMAELENALEELIKKYGPSARFLLEEKIIGDEISILGFTDGQDCKLFPPAQDHKQLLDGDLGPNTGGMGVISPVPACHEDILAQIQEEIIAPTIAGLAAENLDYKGVIYFGVMLSEEGPKLLEYNVRFGDPETEVLLPQLKTPLLPLVQACLLGELAQAEMEFWPGYFVDVVQVAPGYPEAYPKGMPLLCQGQMPKDILVFYAGVSRIDGQLCSSGGRVLNMLAQAATLKEAQEKAYLACQQLSFEGAFYRKDIGQRIYKVLKA